jgi:hypothetical protein
MGSRPDMTRGDDRMELIGYKAYRKGFFGCLVRGEQVVCFLFAKQTVRVITCYPKSDYVSYDHFVASLHKFVPRHFFLRRPLPLLSLEAGYLSAIGRKLACGPAHEMFRSLHDHGPTPVGWGGP